MPDPPRKPVARRRTTSNKRTEAYSVLVECADERQQRQVYEQLQAQGLKCRVLTL